jgi:hypothetical protein
VSDSLVVVGTLAGRADLWMVDAGDGTTTRLTDDVYDEKDPTWTPDGRTITFSADRLAPVVLSPLRQEKGYGAYGIFGLDLETRTVTRTLDTFGDDHAPAWSPDGRKLAFISERAGAPNIFLYNVEDSTFTQLTDVLGGIQSLSWSRQNDRLVFSAFNRGGFDVFAVKEPPRPAALRRVRSPLSLGELARLGGFYWFVVGIATVFTLARFSEAFLILRAQSVGLPIFLVPAVMVVMNIVYALSAYPVGILSDRYDRTAVLMIGIVLLIAADLVLGFASGVLGVAVGVMLWGLHMGFTQGLLATLVADAAPAELRGTAFGMFNLLGGLALLAASIVAGALWDAAGPKGTFLAGAAFTVLALAGLAAIRSRLAPPTPSS